MPRPSGPYLNGSDSPTPSLSTSNQPLRARQLRRSLGLFPLPITKPKLIQPSIRATRLQELGVSSGLDDPAFGQHDDEVRLLDCRKPMRDAQGRASLHQFF